MTLPPSCLVLIERCGELDWLGQFPDVATAQAAMTAWLHGEDRDPEDVAFILPILGWGRALENRQVAAAVSGHQFGDNKRAPEGAGSFRPPAGVSMQQVDPSA